MALIPISLKVNGTRFERAVEPRRLLSDFLREDLDLKATHVGCEHGVCGTCTVLVDGQAVRSCLSFAVQADGCEVRTADGLAKGGKLDVDKGRLAATITMPSCASPAIDLVVKWMRTGGVPPALTVLAPSAYPAR